MALRTRNSRAWLRTTPVSRPTPKPGPCPVKDVTGWFEPSQAVWQDDPLRLTPHIPDKVASGSRSGKRLVQLTPNTYEAELPMVSGKPTLLFGIDHTGANAPEDFIRIVIKGVATGTTPVPVAMLFSGEGAGVLLVHASPLLTTIPLDGPCGPDQPFSVTLYAGDGIPEPPEPPFRFVGTGQYTLTNELVREDGEGTGIKVTVSGRVVRTTMPSVAFVPMRMSGATATREASDVLQRLSDGLAASSAAYIPDFYPLRPGDLTVIKAPVMDARATIKREVDSFGTWVHSSVSSGATGKAVRDAVIAAVADAAALGGALGKQGRTVVVFDPADEPVAGLASSAKFVGLAISQKVVLVLGTDDYFTVAHELAHTMPYVWSGTQQQEQCDLTYHNQSVATSLAHGFAVTMGGTEYRKSMRANPSFMGSSSGPGQWTDQCTYWQLVNVLRQPPDPPVVVVRGVQARNGDAVAGQLLPAYQVDGAVDLAAGDGGDWAIVARSADGSVLGRYPFEPAWAIPDLEGERDLLSFLYRIPASGGVARVDLEGPGARLDELDWSAHAPRVTITAPADDTIVDPVGGAVHVTWTGSDADADPLLYTVLTSDDGDVFVAQSVEQTGTSFDVVVPAGGSQVLRVVATDGARSSESTVRISTETTAGFVSTLEAAFRAGTAASLVGRLDPAVLKRYGKDQCQEYLAAQVVPTLGYAIVAQAGPAPWRYVSDGQTKRVPFVYTLSVDRTADGATERVAMHLGLRSGRLTFFADCGVPG
jgi:hypothetical protein